MSAVSLDIDYVESRNRLTSFFRMILAIPHFIVAGAWQYLAQLLALIQWFIVLFTGKRNDGIWKMQHSWLGYATRVNAYAGLLYDPYPPFGTDPGNTGVRFSLEQPTEADRLTNALRLIWAIPAILIGIVISIGAMFVVLASWVVILFTGKHPRGMFDFLLKVSRFTSRLNSYTMLMTDTYPKYE